MLVKSHICCWQVGRKELQHYICAHLNRGAWAFPSSALGNWQKDHTHATQLPLLIPSHLLLEFQLQHETWIYQHTSSYWRGWTAPQFLISISTDDPMNSISSSNVNTLFSAFPLCSQVALYVSLHNSGTHLGYHNKQIVTFLVVLFQGDISLSPAEEKPSGCRSPINTWKTAP